MCNNDTSVKIYDCHKLDDEKSNDEKLTIQNKLPFEILAKALSYLDAGNLISSAHTSKIFLKAAMNTKIDGALKAIDKFSLFLKKNLNKDFKMFSTPFKKNRIEISHATNFVKVKNLSKEIAKYTQKSLHISALIYCEFEQNLAFRADKICAIYKRVRKIGDKDFDVAIEEIKKIPIQNGGIELGTCLYKITLNLALKILMSGDIDKAIEVGYLGKPRSDIFYYIVRFLSNKKNSDEAIRVAEHIKEQNERIYSEALEIIISDISSYSIDYEDKTMKIADMIPCQDIRSKCIEYIKGK